MEDRVYDITNSILLSVKKLLGIEPEMKEFDADIIMTINSAIAIISQIGIGSSPNVFQISGEEETYYDYLGSDTTKMEDLIKMYLFYKVKLSFDPPTSTAVAECYKEFIKELEWRLNVMVETTPDS